MGKNSTYLLLFAARLHFVPFLKKKLAIILCERKTIKWAAKVAIKDSYCQEKKKRVRKKNGKVQILAYGHARKQKNTLLNYIIVIRGDWL